MPLIDPPPPPNRRGLGPAALATLGAVLLILGAREATTTKAAAASLATTEQTPPLPQLPAAIACVFGVCADETAATAALTGQSSWCHWGSSRPQFGTGSELDARLWLASAETGYAEQPPDDDGDAPAASGGPPKPPGREQEEDAQLTQETGQRLVQCDQLVQNDVMYRLFRRVSR